MSGSVSLVNGHIDPDKRRMTDKEIIKALEIEIHQAEYVDSNYCNGVDLSLVKSTLDLINRQQAEIENITEKFNCQQTVYADLSKIIKDKNAEIERLQSRNNFLEIEYKNQSNLFWVRVNGTKTEAIKELEEKLEEKKQSITTGHGVTEDMVSVYDINNLVKETVGDDK